MASDDARSAADNTGDQKFWWLIAGRLAAAVILVMASTIWTRASLTDPGRDLMRGALPIFLVVVALSLVYALALRFFGYRKYQASAQLLGDVLLSTWLVWVTNDVHSPYTALYIILIPLAGVFLGPKGALLMSVCCALAFTGIMVATATGLIQPFARVVTEDSTPKIIQTIGLNDIAFLVVGLLTARLTERQSRYDVRLKATTQTLANLRALHERIVESIRSGVVTTDLHGRIYTFNAAAEEITGYKASDVREKEVSILFGDLREQIEESMSAARLGETSPRFEAECLTPDGLRLRLGFSIFPLSAESGETTGLVITFQDLTQVRTLEEAARRQDRLAAVGRMAASIAHEIRNPLAAMRGSIQLLRAEMNGDDSQAELMEIVLRESDRLNRIITDYLTYARPRAQQLSNVDVRELLHETFTLLRNSPELRDGHKLEVDLPETPVMAHVDAAQIRQVFWNLARNALQAMPDGGTLRAELQRTTAERLRITFSDTGRGMPPEQVEHLFEPFSSTTAGGTGLGLSIVYQIIREHNGTINVRSREAHGTTITIELPGEQRPETRN